MPDDHIHTEHPLKLNFSGYLSRLSDEERETRLGAERHNAYKEGKLDISEYLPPSHGERFTIEDLKRADIDSFIVQK